VRIAEAERIIREDERHKYRVSFEVRERGMLRGDYFPEAGESPFDNLGEAQKVADAFAATDPEKKRFVNIRVIYARTYTPVADDPMRNPL
jgi:hypothetical protein